MRSPPHEPTLLQPLLVAVRMERLKDGCLEFVAHFLRSLAQDVLEAVLLATLLEASREDLCDRFEHSRIPVRHDEQRLHGDVYLRLGLSVGEMTLRLTVHSITAKIAPRDLRCALNGA